MIDDGYGSLMIKSMAYSSESRFIAGCASARTTATRQIDLQMAMAQKLCNEKRPQVFLVVDNFEFEPW